MSAASEANNEGDDPFHNKSLFSSQFVTDLKHFAASVFFLLLSVSKVWSTPGVDYLGAFHAGVWCECCLLCKRHHVQHLALL